MVIIDWMDFSGISKLCNVCKTCLFCDKWSIKSKNVCLFWLTHSKAWTSRASGRKAMQARHQTVAMIVKSCFVPQLLTKCIWLYFVSSISYRPTDLSLSKEFSKIGSFSNSYNLFPQPVVQKLSMSTSKVIKLSFLSEKVIILTFKWLL